MEATSVVPGAAGKPAGSVVPGAAGGGSVVDAVTFPDGAGWSGAGCSFIDEKRVLEQPAASSAASETATRPVFEKAIIPSVGHPSAPQEQSFRHHQTGEGGQISARYG